MAKEITWTILIFRQSVEMRFLGLKLCALLIFWLKRFQGTSTDGRSCLIGQIPAKRCLPQVSLRDIVAGLFSNTLPCVASFIFFIKGV